MEKRVKEEARSITANCNIKIFGKLEDPTQTKEFFEKTVGTSIVMESSGFQLQGDRQTGSYYDTKQAGVQMRARASYDGLKAFKEGQAVIAFGSMVVDTNIFYSNPGHAKAMRVTRYVALPPPDEQMLSAAPMITKLRDLMVDKTWTAMKADVTTNTPAEITALAQGFDEAIAADKTGTDAGMIAIANVFALTNPLVSISTSGGGDQSAAPQLQKPAAQIGAQPAGMPPIFTAQKTGAQPIPVSAEASDGGANPMAFFGKPGEGGAPIARPLNWDELSAVPTQEAQPAPLPSLDPLTEKILKQAGDAARDALFGKAKDKNSDATE